MMQRIPQSEPPDPKNKDATLSNDTAINSPLAFQLELAPSFRDLFHRSETQHDRTSIV